MMTKLTRGIERRKFLTGLAKTGALCLGQQCLSKPLSAQLASRKKQERSGRLFPAGIAPCEFHEFEAEGFAVPASGVIYDRKHPASSGMALGAIDTGYVELSTNGTFGCCTAFNSIAPQRGPLNLPFLGLSVGDQCWLLANPVGSFGEYMFNGVQTPSDIRYWGHFPVADLEYETPGSPLDIGLRAWTPFLPGDAKGSNTPAAVFEVHLRNHSSQLQQGRIAFTFPGPTQAEAQIARHSPRERHTDPYVEWVPASVNSTRSARRQVHGEFCGIVVSSEQQPRIGYALGVIGRGQDEIHSGGSLSGDGMPYSSGAAWSRIKDKLPAAQGNDFGGSVSAPFDLAPGQSDVVRFVIAWFAPMWIGEGEHTFTHMYATRFQNAEEVAAHIARNQRSLSQRILSWQQVIYSEKNLPIWLRESLVNILYLFAVNSLWAAAEPPIGPWCRPEDGLFGMIDGLVEDPAVEPMPDTFYANAPIVYFFPDLALSTARGYKAYQFSNGAAPWIFGGVVGEASGGYEMTAGTEMASPTPGYQATTTGPSYVDMIDRLWQRTSDDKILREFYPSIKANTIFTMGLRTGDGDADIVSVPTGNVDPERPKEQPGYHLEWFESVLFFGIAPHVGGIHLANLRMAQRMAEHVGDHAFAQQCSDWLTRGSAVLEQRTWTGRSYLTYLEEKTGRRSDDIFAYTLDGEWMARFHGLKGVFDAEHTQIMLKTIRDSCVRLTDYGAVNLARPDGSLAQGVGYGPNAFFVPELYMLGMTYMYAGDRAFGLELARRCVEALTIEDGVVWNQPNIIRGDNGGALFGSHYDQNMMLWALPAAMAGQDIHTACQAGGLIQRVCEAASKNAH